MQGINFLLELAVYSHCTKGSFGLWWEERETNNYFHSCRVSGWLQSPCLQLALCLWWVCIAHRSPLEHNRVLLVCILLGAAGLQQQEEELQSFPETASNSWGEGGCKKQCQETGSKKLMLNQAILTHETQQRSVSPLGSEAVSVLLSPAQLSFL